MKKWLILMCTFISIPTISSGQDWQSMLMLDSRVGYTSNTYLKPLLPEWNPSEEIGFATISPLARISVSGERWTTEITGVGIYEPFFDERKSWYGGFGFVNTRYRLTDSFGIGAEGGAGKTSATFDRTLIWALPVLSWSPNFFTRLQFKAGPFFRKLDGLEENANREFERFDSYGLEVETWPTFKWQLRGNIYGNLDEPFGSFSSRLSVTYRLNTDWQLIGRGGLERYQFQVITETGNGGPPFGGGGPGAGGNQDLVDESSKLYRAGLGVNYQLNKRVALSGNVDYLNFQSSVSGNSEPDFQVSAGVQISMFPNISRDSGADVDWRQNDQQTIILNLNYSGDGDLYILGEFNDWERPGVPLIHQQRNRYVAQLSLEPGAYEYKILLVDGSEEKWLELSDETYTVPDGFGGENGFIFID